MKYIFLSQNFYRDYAHCPELELKEIRPYTQVKIELNGLVFAVPLRSHICHPHVLWTDRPNRCGLDFSKAVVILKTEYIDLSKRPHIRQNEFDALRGKEYIIQQKLIKYIHRYQEAKRDQTIQRNVDLCRFSALQYFETYLSGI